MKKVQVQCNPHPDAPHGFSRDSSHSLGRYVCDCEGWTPNESPSIAPTISDTTHLRMNRQGAMFFTDSIHSNFKAAFHSVTGNLLSVELLPAPPQVPDCRTCTQHVVSCWSHMPCTNGDKYIEAPRVVLWRTE